MRLKTIVLAGIATAVMVFSGFVQPAAAAFPSYQFVDLGTVPGDSAISYGWALNDSGQSVGESASWSFEMGRGIHYDGALHMLGTFGGPVSRAYGINNLGHIVGGAATATQLHAFLYDGAMHDLGALGGTLSGANDINDLGQITGLLVTSDDRWHLFLYEDGVMHDLGSMGGTYINGLAINNHGKITGYASPAGQTEDHAFLYDGSFHDLGTLGGAYSEGTDINDAGYIVGHSGGRPFFYDGTMHDLGFNGYAYGINEQNQIVGSASFGADPNDSYRAFLYDTTNGLVDLNTLIDPQPGWILYSANDINELGQIVGTGYLNGLPRAFLLTPVPEPSTIFLGAFGLASLCLTPVLRVRSRRTGLTKVAAHRRCK